jgi:hypothetical protein
MVRSRSNLVTGLVLILLGFLFLSYQLVPGLWSWLNIELSWPLIVVGVGALFLLIGLLVGAPGMAVPATIIGGIGGLLYWQNATGNWESWAYAWTLIPGFVGVGVILATLLGGGRLSEGLSGGGTLVLTSLVLFAIFGSFLGGLDLFGPYWPVLLIGLGLLILLRSITRRTAE